MYVYVDACVSSHVCARLCLRVWKPEVVFTCLNHCLLHFLRQGLSLNLELTYLALLRAPLNPSSTPQLWSYTGMLLS